MGSDNEEKEEEAEVEAEKYDDEINDDEDDDDSDIASSFLSPTNPQTDIQQKRERLDFSYLSLFAFDCEKSG